MGKVLLQTALFVGLFFATWWGLGSIRWMETFRIRTFTNEKQAQLSEWLLELQRAEKNEIENEAILGKIRKIKQVICERNGIDTGLIKVHVFEDGEINAFAMPGGHIVVNTELINYCDNADMLAGVMAHEIAHVRMEHVSRRLTREIGMGTLLALSGG
ncbi:MAG TPA: M48 family metalloprotease, partial [Flavipsychrobacter sp.]|nr:M48 family metalloprotease [Flavipsychrobacter sp.]